MRAGVMKTGTELEPLFTTLPHTHLEPRPLGSKLTPDRVA
jgi:hypothetical protein